MPNYVPQIGKFTEVPRTVQFGASRIDRLSFCTTPIEIIGDGCISSASHATGFFWKRENQSYLVTNWHVLSGVDPLSKGRNPNGLIPRWLEYFTVRFAPADNLSGYYAPIRTRKRIEIKPFGYDQWFQHPNFNEYGIDIVAIPIGEGGSVSTDAHVDEYRFESLFHFVGDAVFVAGYPLKSYADTMIPIWKRGSLATEPLFQIDDRPLFLIDASTTEGMSGSPVFRRTFGPAMMADRSSNLGAGVTTEFVGVYAGNLLHPELKRIGIGYAWYGKLVDEIIDGKNEGCIV